MFVETMPEVLQDPGCPGRSTTRTARSTARQHAVDAAVQEPAHVLPAVPEAKNPTLYATPSTTTAPTCPAQSGLSSRSQHFARDVTKNRLPAVSWVVPPVGFDEHPPAPPALGEWYTAQVLATLMSNPDVWASTVLFIMYDENDGFFDHVRLRPLHRGPPGEYLTVSPRRRPYPGPIGFGFRVPMMVVSPFSRAAGCAPTSSTTRRSSSSSPSGWCDGPQRFGLAQEDRRRPHRDAPDPTSTPVTTTPTWPRRRRTSRRACQRTRAPRAASRARPEEPEAVCGPESAKAAEAGDRQAQAHTEVAHTEVTPATRF